MAEITLYGFCEAAVNQGDTAYVRGLGNDNSALGFSSSNSTYNNIKRTATARGLWIIEGTNVGLQESTPLNCVSIGTGTGGDIHTSNSFIFYQSGASTPTYPENGGITEDAASLNAGGFGGGFPNPEWMLNLRFDHSLSQVGCTDVQAWFSSSDATTPFTFAKMFICEIRSTGYTEWRRAHSDSKYSLADQTDTSYRHEFYIGISAVPSSEAVGHCGWGTFRASLTYA